MAAYISVPRDLTKVKSKVAFNLTKRQLLCFGTAALIGVPLFFVLRDSGGIFKEKVIAKYSMTSKHNNTQWKNCQEATGYLEGFSRIM